MFMKSKQMLNKIAKYENRAKTHLLTSVGEKKCMHTLCVFPGKKCYLGYNQSYISYTG